MMLKEDLINRIKDYFGLNIYETKIWLALLAKGVASAGEVASLSKVPRSRAYDVLESLEKKGFAIVKIGKPVKYLGVKPKTILEKLKNNLKREVTNKISTLSSVGDTEEFKEIEKIYYGGVGSVRKEDLSASISGRLNISSHLKEMVDRAKKEVIISVDAQEIKSRKRLYNQTFNILREARVKIVLLLFGDEELIKKIEEIFKIKAVRANIKSRFILVDRNEIFFYLLEEGTKEDIGVWLNSSFFAEAFSKLLEKVIEK